MYFDVLHMKIKKKSMPFRACFRDIDLKNRNILERQYNDVNLIKCDFTMQMRGVA